jgi:HAD superfamily hydrolase (TIGR01549 family)
MNDGRICPPPRLVLFDLDDTLCDYASARVGRLRRAFGEALARVPGGDHVDLDKMVAESIKIQPHGSDHFGQMLSKYGAGRDDLVQRAKAWFHSNRFMGLALFPGAADLLDDLRALDPAPGIGLITNGPTEVQEAKLDLLKIRGKIDFALISESFGAPKPDPKIFAAALEQGHATANEAVFIGDSPEYDIDGARRAGIRTVWMDHGRTPWPANLPRPDWTVHNIAELRTLLLGDRSPGSGAQ